MALKRPRAGFYAIPGPDPTRSRCSVQPLAIGMESPRNSISRLQLWAPRRGHRCDLHEHPTMPQQPPIASAAADQPTSIRNLAGDALTANTAAASTEGRRRLIAATPFILCDPGTIPPRDWLYGRNYIRKFVSATVAPGALGKSSLVLVEIVAMVTNLPLLGIVPSAPLRVWYFNGEDPREEIQRRIAATAIRYRIAPSELEGRLFVDSGRERKLVIARENGNGISIQDQLIKDLIAILTENRIDVLVIDPTVTSHVVNENNNMQIAAVCDLWAKIAEVANCAVALIHHVRKGSNGFGGGELTADDARGAGALVAAARTVRVLNPMTKSEAERCGVEQPRGYFRADDGKANMAPAEVARWYHLASVDLGNATGDLPSDHVAVVEVWKWPDPLAELTKRDLHEVQNRVANGDARLDAQAKGWVGNIVGDVLGLNVADARARAKIKSIVKIWIKNGALRVVTRPDERRRMKQFVTTGEPAQL